MKSVVKATSEWNNCFRCADLSLANAGSYFMCKGEELAPKKTDVLCCDPADTASKLCQDSNKCTLPYKDIDKSLWYA